MSLSLSEKVRRVLVDQQISEEELGHMLNRSAITSVGDFRRRYHDWLFGVEGDTVINMARFPQKGHGPVEVFCDECDGAGCRVCNFWGLIRINER